MTRNVFFILILWVAFAGASPVSAQNSAWRCVKRSDNIRVYSRKSDSANYKVIKVTTLLKTTLSSLVMLLTDPPNSKNWVYMNKKVEILEKNDVYSWILYSQTNAPWPITDRDIISSAFLTQDSVTKTVTIRGEAIPRYRPTDNDYVRIPFARYQWRFIPTQDSMVEVEFTLELDVGGKIPQWLVNMVVIKGPFQTIRGLRKEIYRKKYRDACLSYIKEP